MKRERWVAPLFLIAVLVQLVPVWSAPYFPTGDGAAHVYNAFVMRELLQGHEGVIAETYAIDWHPYPNVLGHVILAMLLGVVTPAVAEKILVSAIILLFLGGAWMFAGAADRRAAIFAFLALPLAHHLLLQLGFYNFCLSAGLYFVTIALWWERRDRPDRQTVTLLALMTLLCYSAHALSTVMLIGSIGVLWLATLPGRPKLRHARHLLAFVPAAALLVWFVLASSRGVTAAWWSAWQRFMFLVQTQIILTFDPIQVTLGRAVFAITVALMIVTVVVERRRREADAFLAVLVAVVAVYALAPAAASGGEVVIERIALLVALLPLPWLTPRLTGPGRAAFAAALFLIALWHAAFLAKHDRDVAREMTALIRAARGVPPDHTMLPLVYDRQPQGMFLNLLMHATAYAAVERRLVDLDNYEPGKGYFPVRLRPGRPHQDVFDLETKPADLDIDAWAPLAQYVFAWHIPDDAPVLPRLDRHYKLVAASKEARIYRRLGPASLAAYDEFLLPVAGTLRAIGGPRGEWWRVDQTMRNRGRRRVEVSLSSCVPSMPCDFDLAPGESRRIAAEDPRRPFIIARIVRPGGRDVVIDTVARRIDRDGTVSQLAVPAVPLASFRKTAIDIAPLPFSGRLTLRVWILGATPSRFTLIAYSEDGRTELARRSIDLAPTGYCTMDLATVLPPLQGRVRLRIDAVYDDTRVWAFVTRRAGERDVGTLYLP